MLKCGEMVIHLLLILYSGIIGMFFGSFLLVVVERSSRGEAWWTGRSHCNTCKRTLSARELIPIVSYLWQKGRCRSCKTSLSCKYPIVELVTGLLTALTFWILGFTLGTLILWCVLMLSLANFLSDLFYMELPDEFSIPSIILAYLYATIFIQRSFLNTLLGMGIGGIFFLIQYLLTRGKGIGSGDIRLGVLMGALLGWPMSIISIMFAYIAGSIISLSLLGLKRLTMKSALPLGVFLIPSMVISLFFYPQILNFISELLYLEL